MTKTAKLTYTALCLALGVILPQAFHLFGGTGPFLPMHIPVLLGGLFLDPAAGLTLGVITPILRKRWFILVQETGRKGILEKFMLSRIPF